MSVADNKEVVKSFFEAGNRGDMDACIALFADDIHWTNLGSTRLSGVYQGKQQLMEQLMGPLFGQLKAGIASEIVDLIGEGDKVVALTNGTATTHDGKPYNNRYCQVMTIRDGKIASVVEYCDTDLIRQVFG